MRMFRLKLRTATQGMSHALALTREAIEKLDEVGAPAHLAAHLDLAACRLSEEISRVSAD